MCLRGELKKEREREHAVGGREAYVKETIHSSAVGVPPHSFLILSRQCAAHIPPTALWAIGFINSAEFHKVGLLGFHNS